MIEMIQRQMIYEKEKLRNKDSKLSDTSELKSKQASNMAEKSLEEDFSGSSAKFQKLFKDSYTKFNQAKDDREKVKDQARLSES